MDSVSVTRHAAMRSASAGRTSSWIREDIGDPNLPFVFAQIGQYPGLPYPQDYWAVVRAEQASISIDCVAMITTADLSEGDVHFTSEAYDIIGERFYNALAPDMLLDCQ